VNSHQASIRVSGVLLASLLFGMTALAALPAGAEIKEREVTVIGTPGNLDHWKLHESKFFNEIIPRRTNGKITANAKPRDEVGMDGFGVMRQLKQGVFDFVFGDFTYVAGDSPELEGVDLTGLAQSVDQYRQMQDVYMPVLQRVMNEKFDATILLTYAWPSQQLWCNLGDRSIKNVALKGLAGKKFRTFSAPQGDFVRGLGGTPVSITFAEVVPALQKGVADCALTGTLPAYSAKWWQVITHNIRLRLGYIGSFLAVRNDVWNDMSDETHQIFKEELAKLKEEMWQWTKDADQLGMDCNAQGPCKLGPPGNMTPIEPSADDKALAKKIISEQVLKGWANRCGEKCAADWNKTVGKLLGLEAKM
jgi:TRAP-type C4-dicarboxylate transport system substrate-binding protein